MGRKADSKCSQDFGECGLALLCLWGHWWRCPEPWTVLLFMVGVLWGFRGTVQSQGSGDSEDRG